MPETTKRTPNGARRRRGRVFAWLDQRARLDAVLRTALDEPIPGGARFAFVFGSGLLFLFLSQFITGVFLALYYVPSADHAHTTVAYLVKAVGSGSFLRSMHAYGSSAIVVVLILHVGQTFLYGAYKGRRELLWLAGCVLGALMLAMAFTGYLLPWDQKAYFATAVGTNIMSEVPGIGEWLKRFVRGGSDMGTLTLSRFFVAHVFLLPAAIFAMVALHVYLFRTAGAAGPISEDAVAPTAKPEPFYPRQLAMDLAFAMILVAAIGALAYAVPAELGPKANPADTQYFPRPEWYYRPAFEWLKFWEGPWSIVGIVVVPLLVVTVFAGVPFLDRSLERRPWKRPVAVGLFLATFGGLVGLGVMKLRGRRASPGRRGATRETARGGSPLRERAVRAGGREAGGGVHRGGSDRRPIARARQSALRGAVVQRVSRRSGRGHERGAEARRSRREARPRAARGRTSKPDGHDARRRDGAARPSRRGREGARALPRKPEVRRSRRGYRRFMSLR